MNTPIIIRNSKIPKALSFVIDIYAITIWPFVFIRDDGNEITINHESIHIKQQQELFILPFYLLYFWEWLIGRMKGLDGREAYLKISFEKEAYSNELNPDYLSTRPKMAWKNYRGNDEVVQRDIS
jgi:hypothetical protein